MPPRDVEQASSMVTRRDPRGAFIRLRPEGSRLVEVCALLLLLAVPAAALVPSLRITQYPRRSWDERHGLPQNSAMDVVETADGYLWIATLEGLVRFDGVRFTVYDRVSNSELTSQRIRVLLPDAAAYLWVGTENGGLLRFDGRSFVAVPAPGAGTRWTVQALLSDRSGTLWIGASDALRRLDAQDGEVRTALAGSSVWALAESSGELRWVGTSQGFLERDGAGFRAPELPIDLSNQEVRALVVDADGSLWVGSRQVGLLHIGFAPTGAASVRQLLAGHDVVRLLKDRDGSLWAGTEGKGLIRVSERGVERLGRGEGFGSDFVLALYEDREGSLWVGADGSGVSQLRNGKFAVLTTAEGLSLDFALSVLEDRHGDLWVGTYGGGLNRVRRHAAAQAIADGGEAQARAYLPADRQQLEVDRWLGELPDRWVWSLLEDRQGALWAGTYAGLTRLVSGSVDTPPEIAAASLHQVRALAEGRGGELWIGSNRLYRWSASDGLAPVEALGDHPISCLLEDLDGALWVGTSDGLFRLTGVEPAILRVEAMDPRVPVRVVFEDREGLLWIGTEGAGLQLWQPGGGRRLTGVDGLPSALVSQILEDDGGHFWMSSNQGLFRVARSDLLAAAKGDSPRLELEVFDAADGLPSREFNGGSQPAGWRGRDGRLWFPSVRGLVGVDPANVPRNELPPPLVVERVLLDARVMEAPYRLPPGRHELQIEYTALSYAAPEEVELRYRLRGFGERWVEAGARRSAFFTHLPPGDYTFEVQACNDDGVWNRQGATLSIEQLPSFHQTLRFRALVALAVAAAAVALYRARVRRLESWARRLSDLVKERTRSLEAEKRKTEFQARKLQQLDEVKSRFFANISHEFRTPLTLILGPVEAALGGAYGELGTVLREKLELVGRSARGQLRLVDQLLQLATLESGTLVISRQVVDLARLLGLLVESFSSLAEKRGIELMLEEQPVPQVHVDSQKMEQVFSNLLSNALKFTEPGGTVTVRLGADSKGCLVEVRDNGCGIREEDLEHLFDRFFRIAGSGLREGAGIGLSLAKEIVALHGGDLWVKSEVGTGSVFRVRLPAALAVTSDVGAGELAVEPPSESWDAPPDSGGAVGETGEPCGPDDGRPLILVVEDHRELRNFVRECLEDRYRVAEAADGGSALELMSDAMPDLVISDVMMPGMDGFELCRAIRDDPVLDHLPVILLTALADRSDKLAGLAVGADAYLPKPFDSVELTSRVGNLIALRARLRERFRELGAVSITEISATSLEEAFLGRAAGAVEKNLSEPSFGVEALAAEVAMSPRNLQRKMRAITGETPHFFIQSLRLQRAAQLLEQRAGNVSEVALAVGFSEPAAFSRAFRKRFGHPPSDLLR